MASEVGRVNVVLGAITKELQKGFAEGKTEMQAFEEQAKKLGKAFAVVGASLAGVSAISVKTAADFEQSMARVGALSGAVGREFEQLGSTARRLAAETKFTANETADAMGFMAMAGFDAQKIMKSLPGVLELSSAAMIDVASAADIATNIMSGFGVEASELGRVNDVLVKALTSSNVDLTELGQAMKFVGPVAKSLDISIEETAAAIGALGDAGIKGGIAGRNLRSVIQKMVKPSKEAQEIFDQLGISLVDDAGKFVGITSAIRMFQDANLNSIQAMKAFGEQATIVSVLTEKGADSLGAFTSALENSGGIAKEISERQMATFSGQITKLKSSLGDLAIDIGNALIPALTAFVAIVKGTVDAFRSLATPIKDLIGWTVGLGAVVGTLGGAYLLLAAKIVPVIANNALLSASFVGLSVAIAPLLIALKVLAAVTLAFVVPFKLVQALIGENTPIIKTAVDAWDSLTESWASAKSTMMNFGLALVEMILKPLAWLVDLLPGVDGAVVALKDSLNKMASEYAENARVAEDFGGSVKESQKKSTEAMMEAQFQAERLSQGLYSLSEQAEEMSSVEIQMEMEIVNEQSVITEAQAAAVKAAAAALDAQRAFNKAVKKELKDRAEQRVKAKVDAAVDRILLEKGALDADQMKTLFEEMFSGTLEKSRIEEVAKVNDISTKEAAKLIAQADALRGMFREVTEGLGEAQIVDIGALMLQRMEEQRQREIKGAAQDKQAFDESQKRKAKAAREQEKRDREAARLEKKIADDRKKAIEQAAKFNDEQNKQTFGAISKALAGVRKIFSGDIFGAVQDALTAAAKGVAKSIGAAAGAAGIPPGLVEDVAGTIFGVFTNAANSIKMAVSRSAGAVGGLLSGAIGAVLGGIGDQRLTGAFDFVKNSFSGVVDGAKGIGQTLAGLAAGLLPLIGPLTAIFISLAATATAIGFVLAVLFTGLGSLAIVVGGIVAVIVGAFAALAVAVTAAAVLITAYLTGTLGALVAAISGAVVAVKAGFAAALTALSGFVTGLAGLAVVPALVAAFAFLATKTKAAGEIQERFSKGVDRIVEALEPAVASLEPLAVIFDSLVSVLIPFVEQLGGVFILFKEEIFEAAKFLAISFATLTIAGLEASNAILEFAQGLLRGMATLLGKIDEGLAALGLDEQFGELTSALDDAASELENFEVDTMPMKSALDDLKRLTISAAEQAIRRSKMRTDEEKEEARKRAKEKAKEAARKFTGLDEADKAARDLSESLSNVPEGFKVARARFEAMDPIAEDFSNSLMDGEDGSGRFLDATTKIAGILEDFAERLAGIGFPGGEGPASRAAGGGFPLPGSVRDLQSAPLAGQLKPSVYIDKIEAVDPEDAADKISRVMESRNFRKFDSPVAGPITIFSKA